MPICTRCKAEKDISDFYRDNRNGTGFHGVCKACERKQSKRSKRDVREYDLMVQYGITLAELEKMRVAQGGKCAICSIESDDLEVDHCHTSLAIRGLLCPPCNQALGLFKDSIESLKIAILYLQKERKLSPEQALLLSIRRRLR